MKFAITTLALSTAIVVGLAAAQDPQPAPKQLPDVTLTGCLIQGSTPNVFLFDNAKKDPKSTTEKGVQYLVVAVGEDLGLPAHLNHEVQLTGTIELKAPLPPGQKPTEKDLSRFNTKTATMVSNTCSVVGGK